MYAMQSLVSSVRVTIESRKRALPESRVTHGKAVQEQEFSKFDYCVQAATRMIAAPFRYLSGLGL